MLHLPKEVALRGSMPELQSSAIHLQTMQGIQETLRISIKCSVSVSNCTKLTKTGSALAKAVGESGEKTAMSFFSSLTSAHAASPKGLEMQWQRPWGGLDGARLSHQDSVRKTSKLERIVALPITSWSATAPGRVTSSALPLWVAFPLPNNVARRCIHPTPLLAAPTALQFSRGKGRIAAVSVVP